MNQHPNVKWVFWETTPQGIEVLCAVCKEGGLATTPGRAEAFALRHAQHQSAASTHYGAGDAVAAATKALGIESCTPCEARRRMLNGLVPKFWPRRG